MATRKRSGSGLRKQTITKLSRGRPSESEDASIALFLNVF